MKYENITLFHKKNDIWESHYFKGIWQGGKGASINKGYDKANDINVWLFFHNNKNLCINDFSIGDFVVKGEIKQKIDMQSDLSKMKIDSFNITTIIENNNCFKKSKHIFLGAK